MLFEIKRGNTLSLDFTRRDASGLAVDITAETVTAAVQLRDFYATLTVTKTDAVNGKLTVSAPASATALWPVATLDADVKYDDGAGNILHSETFRIRVRKQVTL